MARGSLAHFPQNFHLYISIFFPESDRNPSVSQNEPSSTSIRTLIPLSFNSQTHHLHLSSFSPFHSTHHYPRFQNPTRKHLLLYTPPLSRQIRSQLPPNRKPLPHLINNRSLLSSTFANRENQPPSLLTRRYFFLFFLPSSSSLIA